VITIRQFQFPQDYEKVLLFWQSAGEGISVGFSDQIDEIEKKVQRDPDLFVVAEDDGALIGTVLGGFDGRRGMVYHLAVAKSHQRQGLATRLMDEIETRLRAKGCRKAYLMVKNGNQDAFAFYETCGWGEMTHVHTYTKTL
jgi:ribosomal protein S18 acetylase RimI-like enzyme